VKVLAGLAVLLLGSGLARFATACAGCRNPNLPITRLSTVHLAPGEIRASGVVSATTLNVVHEAGCADPTDCQEVPVQPRFLHDQDISPAEIRAVAEIGLTRQLGLELQVPCRVTRTTIRYTDPAGQSYRPLDPEVHHRNETMAGIGDPWMLGRWGRSVAGTAVTARAGVSIPLGGTEEDPFALSARGERHQHIQFGNGTFDPLLMLDLSRTIAPVDLSAYGQAQLTLYRIQRAFGPATGTSPGSRPAPRCRRRSPSRWVSICSPSVRSAGPARSSRTGTWAGRSCSAGSRSVVLSAERSPASLSACLSTAASWRATQRRVACPPPSC
jgi:hypothetical protein